MTGIRYQQIAGGDEHHSAQHNTGYANHEFRKRFFLQQEHLLTK